MSNTSNLPNPKTVLSLDIETAPIMERYEDLSDQYRVAWRRKNTQNGVVCNTPFIPPKSIRSKSRLEQLQADFEGDLLSKSWTKTSQLYPEFGRIVCISVGTFKGKGLEVTSYYGYDEASILRSFFNGFGTRNELFVGHAIHYFDLPFIIKRAMALGVLMPKRFITYCNPNIKPWERTDICTNLTYRVGSSPGSSLEALCAMLGIKSPKENAHGSEVGQMFYEGRIEEIADYCAEDVLATHKIFFRMYYAFCVEDTPDNQKNYKKALTPGYWNRIDLNHIKKMRGETLDLSKQVTNEDNKIIEE